MRNHFLTSMIFTVLFVAANPAPAMAEALNVGTPALDSAALAATTGTGEADVNSTISNNSIGNVGYTGGIANVSATNNSGLTTLIENTGNQVSISTATVVNVTFH